MKNSGRVSFLIANYRAIQERAALTSAFKYFIARARRPVASRRCECSKGKKIFLRLIFIIEVPGKHRKLYCAKFAQLFQRYDWHEYRWLLSFHFLAS